MATYRPSTTDDSDVLARRARDMRRQAEAAAAPSRTMTYQAVDKIDYVLHHGSYKPGQDIDITDMTISALEMGVGQVDAICTLDDE